MRSKKRLPVEDTENKLEPLYGSTYCQYSVIENQLAVLYRNQEKIMKVLREIHKRVGSER